jgi:hypothetical protein
MPVGAWRRGSSRGAAEVELLVRLWADVGPRASRPVCSWPEPPMPMQRAAVRPALVVPADDGSVGSSTPPRRGHRSFAAEQ